jgi:hypothetical protein
MKKGLLLCSLIFAALLSAFAQNDIQVRVVNLADLRPLEGQEVTLANYEIGLDQSAVSDDQGLVRFTGLPITGTYFISAPGGDDFHPSETYQLQLSSNEDRSVTLLLPSKRQYSINEVIVMEKTGSVDINTLNATVKSQLDEKEIEELPVEGRDLTRVLYRLPNVSQSTGFYPEAPFVSINGANGLFTQYQIDGLGNNENFLGGPKFPIPTGMVKEVSVLSNNFSSEFGWTSNGVFNVTTQSGTNDFKGEVYYVLRPGPPFDASSPFAQRDLSGNQVKDGFRRHQVGTAFGGAIKKNKTFYFVDVEFTRDKKDNLLNSPDLGVNETVRGYNDFILLSGKLDHTLSDRYKTTLRAHIGLVDIDRQGGGLEGGVSFPSAANSQQRNSVIVAWQNVLKGKRYKEEFNVQYSRFHWNYAEAANPNSPQTTVLNPNEQAVAIIGNPGYRFHDIENSLQIQDKWTFFLGDHVLKVGGDYRFSRFNLAGGGNPNGNYTVKLTQGELDAIAASNIGAALDVDDIPDSAEVLNYAVELRETTVGADQHLVGMYLEDQVQFGRLRVNLGLRWDFDNLSAGGGDNYDFNNVAPRISANYQIDEKRSVRLGYGMYYDKVYYAYYSDALQFNNNSDDYKRQIQELIDQGILPSSTNIDAVTNEGNLTATVNNVPYLGGPTSEDLQGQRESIFSNELRILNPNGYQNPYSHQFMIGYQQQINKEMLFYVDLMHNRSHNLSNIYNLNAPAAYPIDPDNVIVRSQSEADLSRPIPIYDGSYTVIDGDTLTGIARNIVMTENAGQSRYYAASFNLTKVRGDDKYSFRLIYTLSRLENNTEDINFRAMDANDFESEWGPSINDRTHMINGFFTWYPVHGLSINAASLLQSGQPINRIPDATLYGTTDLNGDGRSFGDAYVGNSDRSPGEMRNSDRLPWSVNFDVGIQYRAELQSYGQVEFRLDVFNLFNVTNLSGYANNATQSNQIQVGPASSGTLVRRNAGAPRQFQLSIRYLF